jgi:hypothetical protein
MTKTPRARKRDKKKKRRKNRGSSGTKDEIIGKMAFR